jgi:sigma-B regulation protein RsbU (phosphoserine phosphatase)
MTIAEDIHEHIETPMQSRRLACAETWSGNGRTSSLVEVPGLTVWAHSSPSELNHAGGDVHYVSLCPSCVVSRIALADVSGHGSEVALIGERIRDLMQRHLCALEQIALMRDLNVAVRQELGTAHYATMVAAGWHGLQSRLVMTNAGHPPPLWYRAAHDEWTWLETPRARERGLRADLPLGLLVDVSYDRLAVEPQSGDLIILYSDGVSEATSPEGIELGRDGLLDMARTLDLSSAEGLGSQLVSGMHVFRGDQEALDDETIIVVQRS